MERQLDNKGEGQLGKLGGEVHIELVKGVSVCVHVGVDVAKGTCLSGADSGDIKGVPGGVVRATISADSPGSRDVNERGSTNLVRWADPLQSPGESQHGG